MESNIRVYNPAKKFAEEVLHPLLKSHNDAKIRSRLGGISDEEAIKLRPAFRMVKRYNATKERIVILQSLLTEVEPTVRLNRRKSEVRLIEELKSQLSSLEDAYEYNSNDILLKSSSGIPSLSPKFKEVNDYLDKIYVQLQRIMTKNKLLFFGDDNEYLENEQLMDRIKSENRKI